MDHVNHNTSEDLEPASHSGSTSKADEKSDAVPVRASKLAKKELQRIKDELSANLEFIHGSSEGNKMSTSSEWSQVEDTVTSTVPTNMTISEVTPLGTDVASMEVLFEARKPAGEPVTSCHNLIPEYEDKIVGRSEFQAPRMTAEEEKRLANLRAVFDSVPTIKPSRAQLQQEFTEDRIQSHKKICELNAEVTVKSKESEFLELQLARNHTELRAARSEIASKDAENKRLRRTIADLESKSSKQILDLTLELQQKAAKLETYKRLYSQMDLLTHVDSVDPERWTPGENLDLKMSTSVPTNFKYKLQQSMDLAQRLKDERNHLERSRDETDRKLKEAEAKYQAVLIELNKLKLAEDMKLTNTKASLQLKCFELERVSLILEEYQQKHKVAISENEKLKRKIELLNEDLNQSRLELNEGVTRLSLELQSKSSKLELYENIEDALDDMILKAATVPDTSVGEDLLGFCSHGASLPTDAGRRLQQAFDLAKKNCELQKAVAEQKEEILALYDERQVLRQEVQSVKSLNGYSVGQLVETITEKNREIGKLNKRISSIERDFCEAKQSKEVLQQTVDNLKDYHDQVLTLFHSGARISQAKNQPRKEAAPVHGGTTTTDCEAVSATSSLHLPCPRHEKFSQSTAASDSVVSTGGQKISVSRKSKDSTLRSTVTPKDVRYVPDINGRKLMDPACWIRNSELRVITEESDDEKIYEADSILMESVSSASVTSSMLAPPPPMVRTRSPIIVSVRKIPSKSSTSTRSYTNTKSSKRNARQVASADLIVEHSKKKDKPVALRLSKVKPSASNFF